MIACIILHNIAVKASIPYDNIDTQEQHEQEDLEVSTKLHNNVTGFQVRQQVIRHYFMWMQLHNTPPSMATLDRVASVRSYH